MDLSRDDDLVTVTEYGSVVAATTHSIPHIVTSCQFPPIPDRRFDWCAHFDGDEESGVYGYGATEAEAIADFVENYASERYARIAA